MNEEQPGLLMSRESLLEETVGQLPERHPDVKFTVNAIGESNVEGKFLHVTFNGVLETILQEGLTPGKPSTNEAMAKANLGLEEAAQEHPNVKPHLKAESTLEKMRTEVPPGEHIFPKRDQTIKLWFDPELVGKMVDSMSPPSKGSDPSERFGAVEGIQGAPYVTLVIKAEELDGKKMVIADYDRVFELTRNILRRGEPGVEVSNEELVYPGFRYWREATVSNGAHSAKHEKEAYHIPELLVEATIPPHAIEQVIVPPGNE